MDDVIKNRMTSESKRFGVYRILDPFSIRRAVSLSATLAGKEPVL
jgi:hypothetical protein